jgi:hypothetical protein
MFKQRYSSEFSEDVFERYLKTLNILVERAGRRIYSHVISRNRIDEILAQLRFLQEDLFNIATTRRSLTEEQQHKIQNLINEVTDILE